MIGTALRPDHSSINVEMRRRNSPHFFWSFHMDYKIAEIKVAEDEFYYLVVGKNNPNEKWHILCEKHKYKDGTGLKLKKLYDNEFINYDGVINESKDNVSFSSETYSFKELIAFLYNNNTNTICFYGCDSGNLILDPISGVTGISSNEFFYISPFKNEENLLLLRVKNEKEDGPFEIDKRNFPELEGTFIRTNKNSYRFNETNFVVTSITQMYPVIHTVRADNIKPSWFTPELKSDEKKSKEAVKTEEITIEKIISEFQTKFPIVKIHNINETGSHKQIDPIIFQFPKCSKEQQAKFESELLDFLKRFGKLGGLGIANNHAIIDEKFLFWISFGSLQDTMSGQNKLKFASSIDGYHHQWIEPIFIENETIRKYLAEKNLTFEDFLKTDFAKENKNYHIDTLVREIKLLLEEDSKQQNIKITKKEIITTSPSKPIEEMVQDEIPGIDIQEMKIEKVESKKSEIKAAAMRSVAKKTIDLSAIAAERAASRLAKTKSTRDSIKKICQMPILKNMFGVGIGYALPVMPVIGTKPITKEIAEEIRIEGMSGIADATIGPLMGLFDSMLEKMPTDEIKEKNRIEDVKLTETDQDDCEEENVERKNRS